jgi:ABC-2 type transport system permease protein
MVIYMMIAMYGTGVTRSVLEEKNNRIAEVLVSSMRATHLMAGKILGVGSAVLLQVLTWVLLIGLLITQSDWLAQRFNVDPAALNALTAQPGTTALLIAYFVLGFLLFAALFAGLGAAVTSDQEAQSFQMFLMVPLFVPLLFLLQLTTRPLEPLARMLGLIPFTAPVAMPMRMAAARIPNSEIVASLALLVVTLALTAWLAGKIYRIGILSTGKRPSMAELIRWLRTS